jgi:4-amino-4-deoxy-L-arabinose transferase-like glycosyltransferase
MLKSKSPLLTILLLSVLLRLGVAIYLGNEPANPPLLVDQVSYHELALRVLDGHGFSFERAWYPFAAAGEPTAHWSFLYTLFLAAVYALTGPHPLAARLVQAVVGGILLPWLAYRLARRVMSSKGQGAGSREVSSWVPLLAALLTAVYLYFVLYAATLMTETFYIICLLWSLERSLALAAWLRGEVEGKWWPVALGLGLSLGLATLIRQSILPWVALLFLYLLWEGWRGGRLRPALSATTAAAVLLAAFILPWTARNFLVYGDFLLLNSNAGYAMSCIRPSTPCTAPASANSRPRRCRPICPAPTRPKWTRP